MSKTTMIRTVLISICIIYCLQSWLAVSKTMMIRTVLIWIWIIYCLQNATSGFVDPKCECGEIMPQTRIINGKTAKPHAYNWMVAIYHWKDFVCGGSLINDRYVLTAGHCIYGGRNPNSYRVILGMHDSKAVGEKGLGGYRFRVKRLILHENYTRHDVYDDNDIALMELKVPAKELSYVGQVCLPWDQHETFANFSAIVTGWGTTSEGGLDSRLLQQTSLNVLSNAECRLNDQIGKAINETMLCAIGENTDGCQGDSGGPLFVEKPGRYEQIGIVSWGIGCARPGMPGVYTRVTEYVDWILENTKNAVYCIQS